MTTQVRAIVLSKNFFYLSGAKLAGVMILLIVTGGAALGVSEMWHDWRRVFLYTNLICIATTLTSIVEWSLRMFRLWEFWREATRRAQRRQFVQTLLEYLKEGRMDENGDCNCANYRARRGERD